MILNFHFHKAYLTSMSLAREPTSIFFVEVEVETTSCISNTKTMGFTPTSPLPIPSNQTGLNSSDHVSTKEKLEKKHQL